jgi:hypothetical protein
MFTARTSLGTASFPIEIIIRSAVMTAHIVANGGEEEGAEGGSDAGGDAGERGWKLEGGILAGKVPTKGLLLELAKFPDALQPTKPVCKENVTINTYFVLRQAACAHADISAGIHGPTEPCDAISLGMAFEAASAKLGGIDISVSPPRCADPLPPLIDSDDCTAPVPPPLSN